MNHTPGPWESSLPGGLIESPSGFVVGCVAAMTDAPDVEAANLRLMTAAPELLEALQRLAAKAAALIDNEAVEPGRCLCWPPMAPCELCVARAVIAKAKGGEP